VRLADALNARRVPGVRFYPVEFTPASSVHAGALCRGVFMVITDRQGIRPVRVGVEIAAAISTLFPGKLTLAPTTRLFGSAAGLARIQAWRRSGRDCAIVGGGRVAMAVAAGEISVVLTRTHATEVASTG
jgi:hypothetical protein